MPDTMKNYFSYNLTRHEILALLFSEDTKYIIVVESGLVGRDRKDWK